MKGIKKFIRDNTRVIVLQPGDTVVLEVQVPISAEKAALLKEQLRKCEVFADRAVVIMDSGTRLLVAREQEVDLQRLADAIASPAELRSRDGL